MGLLISPIVSRFETWPLKESPDRVYDDFSLVDLLGVL